MEYKGTEYNSDEKTLKNMEEAINNKAKKLKISSIKKLNKKEA